MNRVSFEITARTGILADHDQHSPEDVERLATMAQSFASILRGERLYESVTVRMDSKRESMCE